MELHQATISSLELFKSRLAEAKKASQDGKSDTFISSQCELKDCDVTGVVLAQKTTARNTSFRNGSVMQISQSELNTCAFFNYLGVATGPLIVHDCNMHRCHVSAAGYIANMELAYAVIRGYVFITHSRNVLVLGPSPSSGAYITVHPDLKLGIRVNTGCFTGTLDDYKYALESTHKDCQANLEYHRSAHNLIKDWVNIRKAQGRVIEPQLAALEEIK